MIKRTKKEATLNSHSCAEGIASFVSRKDPEALYFIFLNIFWATNN